MANKIEEKKQENRLLEGQPLIMPGSEEQPSLTVPPPEQSSKEMPVVSAEPRQPAEIEEGVKKPPETPIPPLPVPPEEKEGTSQFWTSEKFVANKEKIGEIEKAAINLGSIPGVNLTEKAANLEKKIYGE